MEEIWKDIEGYEGIYQASNCGNVKSLPRKVSFGCNERITPLLILSKKQKAEGYLCVILYKDKKDKTFYIHRLVAKLFCPNYFEGAQVNHKDGNKKNNNFENLEWVSRSENQKHAYDILKRGCYSKGRFGKLSHISKPIIQLSLNGDTIKYWDCAADVQRELGLGESNIRRCLYGKQKTAYGYKWNYQGKVKELKKEKGI